jgi:hypothetical protein
MLHAGVEVRNGWKSLSYRHRKTSWRVGDVTTASDCAHDIVAAQRMATPPALRNSGLWEMKKKKQKTGNVRETIVVVEKINNYHIFLCERLWVHKGRRVALLIQHIVICGLSGSTTFFDILS